MKYIEEKSRMGISHKKFTSEFGAKILGKFGWNEGEGLGKNKNGITEAIQIKRREENIGIGKKKKEQKWNDKWWESSYNNILNNMKNNDKVSTISSSSDDGNDNIKVENKEKKNKKIQKIIKDNDFQKEIKVIGKKRKITLIDI
jgi:hypothetical protein